jgi:hypothetical protein
MADREAALAELLGEIGAVETGEDGMANLNLGNLDVTTTGEEEEDDEDALSLMMSGLDLELIKYADHGVVGLYKLSAVDP